MTNVKVEHGEKSESKRAQSPFSLKTVLQEDLKH